MLRARGAERGSVGEGVRTVTILMIAIGCGSVVAAVGMVLFDWWGFE